MYSNTGNTSVAPARAKSTAASFATRQAAILLVQQQQQQRERYRNPASLHASLDSLRSSGQSLALPFFQQLHMQCHCLFCQKVITV